MNRRTIFGLFVGFGFALAVAAGLSGRPGSLGVLTPRTGPGHRVAALSGATTCLAAKNGAYHWNTNPCEIVPFGAAMTINAVAGGACACWSLSSSVSIGRSSTCGNVTDANDGAAAVVGNCFELIQGQIVDASPSRAWFNRVGVGRRTGYCTVDKRPCRVDADCMGYSGPCVDGGVGAPSGETAGAYLLIASTSTSAIAFVGNSVGE